MQCGIYLFHSNSIDYLLVLIARQRHKNAGCHLHEAWGWTGRKFLG